MSIVIAVDGTAASGKGTLARRLAQHFGFAYMDSGALYRLTALAVIKAEKKPERETDALRGAASIDLRRVNDPAIRSAKVGRVAAIVAAIPSVRERLLSFQRQFAAHPPNGSSGSVIDGRDIGTVVCPDADVKFFVDAAIGVRAHRRYLELIARNEMLSETEVLRDLIARDAADRGRKVSPLVHADDAILIDTTELSVEEMCTSAISEAEQRLSDKLRQMELPLSDE